MTGIISYEAIISTAKEWMHWRGTILHNIYRTLTLQTNKIEDERWNDVIFYSINIVALLLGI
jgi:hypothetical protein